MNIGSGANTYEWQGSWAKIPESPSAGSGWAHHGVVVTESGQVVTYHPGDPTMMLFDPMKIVQKSSSSLNALNHCNEDKIGKGNYMFFTQTDLKITVQPRAS